MKKLLKLFAFIGGISAVAGWLIQNRIVTVTMSREPSNPEPVPEPDHHNSVGETEPS